jgi:hypothetical protein
MHVVHTWEVGYRGAQSKWNNRFIRKQLSHNIIPRKYYHTNSHGEKRIKRLLSWELTVTMDQAVANDHSFTSHISSNNTSKSQGKTMS